MLASDPGAVTLPSGKAGRLASGGERGRDAAEERRARARKLGVRSVALGYLAVLLLAPVALIFYRTFEHGLAPVWEAITPPTRCTPSGCRSRSSRSPCR